MKRKIACEVIYPVQFQIEINDKEDIDITRNKIKALADKLFDSSSIKPKILHCSGEPPGDREAITRNSCF